ncbi:DUF4113 domain-containing protein [Vibrio harveyi]|uniref:Y-family DNA polymerase n=1 Tax=Vibrio harveyi TaxID=669 RepID=UPI000841A3DC|nr:DUF4113 domain-containing protein [Vibrio harveyi]ODM55874.1 nucleotidyltransferase [Vibrio harveyi]
MFALLDGTAFYAEASCIYRPELRGRPVIVVAGQGISIAANRACTKLGIKKFNPIWLDAEKIKVLDGAIFKSNFNTMSHISDRFMSCIESSCVGARVHRYSVDEVIVDLHYLHSINVDLEEFILSLRKKVYKETGVAIGGGVGKTITLAKCASWAAKNSPEYKGVCVLENESHVEKVLARLPIDKVWNIGKSYARSLTHEGIITALQLMTCDPVVYQRKYSINLANVITELNSISVLNFDDTRTKKKQIWSTQSYRDRLKCRDKLQSELSYHCGEVMRKVRENKTEALRMRFLVSTSSYDKCEPYSRTVDVQFENGMTDTIHALASLRGIVDKLLPKDLCWQPIYKLGVGIIHMVDGEKKQLDLFNRFDNKDKLNTAIDSLNARFGKGTIIFGAQKRAYMEREGDSIQYSRLEDYYTDCSDLLRVKCI